MSRGYDPLAVGAEVYTGLRRDCPVHHHRVPESEQRRHAGRIALRTVLTRLPGLRLDPDRPPVCTTSWTVNGWASLPVLW